MTKPATTSANDSRRPLALVTGGTGFLGTHLLRLLAGQSDAGTLGGSPLPPAPDYAGRSPAASTRSDAGTLGGSPLPPAPDYAGRSPAASTRSDAAKRVRVLAHSAPPAWLRALGVEIAEGSITSPDDVKRALDGVGEVYHLAGLVSHLPADGHKMYAVHVDGTRVLCEAAAQAGVRRIVMASTSGTVAVSRRADDVADEDAPTPLDLVARWPYYASKLYQEETAKRACGDKVALVTLNPSLLLGPGDDRLSSTRPILQFIARDIALMPAGGLNVVDARDVAALMPVAMSRGTPGARYLVGAVNWTFAELFGRLERLTKIPGPKLKLTGDLPFLASRAQAAVYRKLGRKVPVEPQSVEMAQYFWYLDSGKASRELGFQPRDPADTLRDTVKYIRDHLLGNSALGGGTVPAFAHG